MYQVLARKYRPRNFIELVGQNHVSRALTSALERGRLHHAYLFTGTRGVGKTTIARILAKCLNCEIGVTSTPCEVCATCTAVNEGRFIDLIEIDAASRTKVEDTRELLDNVPYAPTQGRYKVYLIDEVHMLSTHSFNALLKTLEEPPAHVKFLFATTDPQKLPITVISRCLQFTLRPLAVDEITTHLTDILNQEQISAEQDAIWQIAESAQGSLRDALSLTDQAIAYGQGAIQHQDVKEMLGLIDRTIIFDLILAIHQNQQQHVSALLMQFRQQALDVSLVLDQFISTLHELALLQYLPELSLKYSAEINQKIMQLSGVIAAQDLQLYYQVACKGRADLQLAVTQEQGFEMCILRLLAFRPLQINEIQNVQSLSVSSNENLNGFEKDFQRNDAEPHLHAQNPTGTITKLTESNFIANHDVENEFTSPAEVDSNIEDQAQTLAVDHEFDEHELDEKESLVDNHSSFHTEVYSNEYNQLDASANAIAPINAELVAIDALDQTQPVEILSTNNDAPELSFFGETHVNSSVKHTNTAEIDEIFFLDPTLEKIDDQDSQSALVKESSVKHLETGSVINEVETQALTLPDNKLSEQALHNDAVEQMPQDILKLSPQVLEGDWSLEKWEYWLRNSDLTPAVQELAQQGVMTGQIDGESTFYIPEKYEKLLTQFQSAMEDMLSNQWTNIRLTVKYQELEGSTPYDKQLERKQRAYQRAEVLLSNEDVVKGLVNTFGGTLHNIQLKP